MRNATYRTALCLAAVAAMLAGCQAGDMTLGPRGELVGFGPVINGRPTGYAPRNSGVSDKEQKQLASALAAEITTSGGKVTKQDLLSEVEQVLHEGASHLTLTIDPEILEYCSPKDVVQLPTGSISVQKAIKLASEFDYLCYRIEKGTLAVRSHYVLVVAYYPVGDLRVMLGRDTEGRSPCDQLRDMLERTVQPATVSDGRNAAAWESMGGAASIEPVKDTLIVSQTPEGHAAVAQRLAAVRLMAALTPTRSPR